MKRMSHEHKTIPNKTGIQVVTEDTRTKYTQIIMICNTRKVQIDGGEDSNSEIYFSSRTFHNINQDIYLPNHNKEEYLKCKIYTYIESTVNVFYNPVFFYNICDSNDGIHLQLNGGNTMSKH